jgi:hypothetical protein
MAQGGRSALLAGLFLASYHTSIVAFAPMVFVIQRRCPGALLAAGSDHRSVLLGIASPAPSARLGHARQVRRHPSCSPIRQLSAAAGDTPTKSAAVARPYIWAGYIDATSTAASRTGCWIRPNA